MKTILLVGKMGPTFSRDIDPTDTVPIEIRAQVYDKKSYQRCLLDTDYVNSRTIRSFVLREMFYNIDSKIRRSE